MHLFGLNCDHDYQFGLPVRGTGRPINFSVFYFTPSRYPGYPACEPNLVIARNPIVYATSSTAERRECAPWLLSRSFGHDAASGGNICCASLDRCAPSPAPLPLTESAASNSP